MRRNILIITLLLLASCVGAWQFWQVKELVFQWRYQLTNPDEKVENKTELSTHLTSFKQFKYSALPQEYLRASGSDLAPFKSMLRHKSYFVIQGDQIFQKVVGNYRVKDFLPKDDTYKNHLRRFKQVNSLYWLIDIELLEKMLELQAYLRREDYDDHGFRIVNGYRPPSYNKAVGGASRSRHIVGEAVDIFIQDINQDGKANQTDKEIILQILDEEIIGNSGGIGRYPGTMSIHFDVRGKRARWDKQ